MDSAVEVKEKKESWYNGERYDCPCGGHFKRTPAGKYLHDHSIRHKQYVENGEVPLPKVSGYKHDINDEFPVGDRRRYYQSNRIASLTHYYRKRAKALAEQDRVLSVEHARIVEEIKKQIKSEMAIKLPSLSSETPSVPSQ